jgi:hypothetical protein
VYEEDECDTGDGFVVFVGDLYDGLAGVTLADVVQCAFAFEDVDDEVLCAAVAGGPCYLSAGGKAERTRNQS